MINMITVSRRQKGKNKIMIEIVSVICKSCGGIGFLPPRKLYDKDEICGVCNGTGQEKVERVNDGTIKTT